MFIIDCSRHGGRVLVGPHRIRGLRNTEAGILLDIECYCGQHELVLTGSHAPQSTDVATPAADTRELAGAGAR